MLSSSTAYCDQLEFLVAIDHFLGIIAFCGVFLSREQKERTLMENKRWEGS